MVFNGGEGDEYVGSSGVAKRMNLLVDCRPMSFLKVKGQVKSSLDRRRKQRER
jgi:hypothetical protein